GAPCGVLAPLPTTDAQRVVELVCRVGAVAPSEESLPAESLFQVIEIVDQRRHAAPPAAVLPPGGTSQVEAWCAGGFRGSLRKVDLGVVLLVNRGRGTPLVLVKVGDVEFTPR